MDQRPIEEQLSSMLSGEFGTLIPGTDETQLAIFRVALAEHLSAPKAFTTRSNGKLIISDLYQDLFLWLANADFHMALDTAQEIVRDLRLAGTPFASSEPLALFLFQAINTQLAAKHLGRSFYEPLLRFALSSPDVVAASIPGILEANIRAAGDDNSLLFRLFQCAPVLETAYRSYLANHYPRLLVKHETRFMARVKSALPHSFIIYLESLDDSQFARVRGSDLIASLDIIRPDQPTDVMSWDTEQRTVLTLQHPTLRAPKDLNQAAAAFSRRVGVQA